MPVPAPDVAQAERFLTLLAEGEEVTFQTFDDRHGKAPKDNRLIRVFHGDLADHAREMAELNERGAGIYWMVNRGDGTGRKSENVTRVRALFLDLDGAPLPGIWALEPHIVVESSPGRYHVYWAVADCPFDRFTPVQRSLAAEFDGDPSVCDLSRVMRLPGFLHRKQAPFMARVIHENPTRPYSLAEFIDGLGLKLTNERARAVPLLGIEHDPILKALSVQGLVKGPVHGKSGAWDMLCPWRDTHTTGDGGTCYFEPHTNGYAGAAFKCWHAHCCGKSIQDLRPFLGWGGSPAQEPPGDNPPIEAYEGCPEAEPGAARLGTHIRPGGGQPPVEMYLEDLAMHEAVAAADGAAEPGSSIEGGMADDSASREESRLREVETFIQSDDPMKQPRRRSQVDILIDIGRKVSMALFCGGDDRAYAIIRDRREVWPIASKRFRQWLCDCYYELVKKGANANSVRDAIDTIEAAARNSGDERPVFLRTAAHAGKVYVDLCDRDWRVVEIDAEDWRILDRSPVMFTRRGSFASFPVPERGGSLSDLWDIVNVPVKARPLIACWLPAALYPSGPYPILGIQGWHGSAKSSAALMLRLLCDPSSAPLRSIPKDEDGFKALCAGAWCLCIDNLSGIQPWLSDLLCRAASGVTLGGRKLYSDLDEELIKVTRPVILNGIEPIAVRGDLADRTITVVLEPIPDDRRLTEKEVGARFEKMRPSIFGVLLTALSQAVRDLPSVPPQPLPRMADFAQRAISYETALGLKAGDFMRAYHGNIEAAAVTTVEGSAVAQAIIRLVTHNVEWSGTATDLLDAIGPKADDRNRSAREWPRSGRGMIGALMNLGPALLRLGVSYGHLKRSDAKGTRLLRLVWRDPAQPSESSESSEPRRGAGSGSDSSKSSDDLTVREPGNRQRPSGQNSNKNNVTDDTDGSDGLAGTLHDGDAGCGGAADSKPPIWEERI